MVYGSFSGLAVWKEVSVALNCAILEGSVGSTPARKQGRAEVPAARRCCHSAGWVAVGARARGNIT